MEPKIRQFDAPTEKQNVDAEQPDESTDADELTHVPTPRVNLERVPTYLQPSISVRERLKHFTFAWYTVTSVSLTHHHLS